MIPVRTLPRFKCDFCKKRSVKSVISRHEKRCFRNPNRFCDACENLGYFVEEDELGTHKEQCPYCNKFDPDVLKAIQKYEEDKVEEGVEDADFQDPKALME